MTEDELFTLRVEYESLIESAVAGRASPHQLLSATEYYLSRLGLHHDLMHPLRLVIYALLPAVQAAFAREDRT